ncbi:hypothetical protein ACFY5F_21560 [Streptomyces sp. NPDC013161]|uniref:hypothetical protein n=1 Tax=Streptomyces sp. NPDC013161 TaxID=3364862 RepID=UPI0036BBC1F4
MAELLDRVGLPKDASQRLPREFGDGRRQHIVIARTRAPAPRLIVRDGSSPRSASPPGPACSTSSLRGRFDIVLAPTGV